MWWLTTLTRLNWRCPHHALCKSLARAAPPSKRLWSAPPPSHLTTQRELERAGYMRGGTPGKHRCRSARGIEARAKNTRLYWYTFAIGPPGSLTPGRSRGCGRVWIALETHFTGTMRVISTCAPRSGTRGPNPELWTIDIFNQYEAAVPSLLLLLLLSSSDN